jgi:Domain of unknown function, B. Theta Gene description (DUF3871)
VFSNNEPLISHADFIDVTASITTHLFNGEHILKPDIRVSHAVMGRIPDAKDKPAHQLLDWEKTLYYQRMAFIIEVPSIQSEVDGNILSLTIGGVRSFADENLGSRNMCDQHFKIFIGFKNTVLRMVALLRLPWCYNTIKVDGGEIKVETKEGEGTEFIIQIPTN